MNEGTTSAANIWRTLASLDCSKHVEKKGNLSYLSWAWAWAMLMEHYPDATVNEEKDPQIHPDGSVTVWCHITIGETTRTMWLPVMDNRNKAIQNPDARAISDAKMRCKVKCLALFGLGHYLYAGEDLPQSEGNAPAHDTPRISEYQVREIEGLLSEVGADREKFLAWLNVEGLGDLPASSYGRAVNALERKREAQEAERLREAEAA